MSNWNQHIISLSLKCFHEVKMKRKMDEITVDNRFKGDEAEV